MCALCVGLDEFQVGQRDVVFLVCVADPGDDVTCYSSQELDHPIAHPRSIALVEEDRTNVRGDGDLGNVLL